MRRSEVREHAFKLLFQHAIQVDDLEGQRTRYLQEHPMEEAQLAFFNQRVQGVQAALESLDETISPRLHKWDISRLPLIDLTILRLALFEMRSCDDTPEAVAISEAVILAKKYSGPNAKDYINGVLGRLSREADATCESS